MLNDFDERSKAQKKKISFSNNQYFISLKYINRSFEELILAIIAFPFLKLNGPCVTQVALEVESSLQHQD